MAANDKSKFKKSLGISDYLFLLVCGAIIFLTYYAGWSYPFWDSFFIVISILFICIVLGIQYRAIKKLDSSSANILSALIFGLIALQAAWPIFMPRISLEDISQQTGIIYADKPEYQVIREAVVRVKPPLFPIPNILADRNYPIANNLKSFDYDDSSPNLQIINAQDGKNIRIILKRVTGWSFDEVAGKITYQADKNFSIRGGGQKISFVNEIKNLASSELFPYDYEGSTWINNPNNFPVRILNLTFWIEKNTSAWDSLKKWTDDGFCIFPLYSDDWNSSSSSRMNVNGNSEDISLKLFNSSNILIQAFYISLAPQETKQPRFIFRETICSYIKNDSSPRIPYLISGKITSKEDVKYYTILIKNVNTGEIASVWGYPNKAYQYELANLPNGYNPGDIIQVSICRNAQDCITSKNITVDMSKGYDEVNFNI